MTQHYLEVSLPPPLARELTYGLPPSLEGNIQVGSLVVVPVAQRMMTGVVIGFTESPDPAGKLKPEAVRDIVQVLAGDSLLAPELIDLCRWMAAYYFAPLASALLTALPPGAQINSNRLVQIRNDSPMQTRNEQEKKLLEQLRLHGPLKVTTLQRRLGRKGLENALRRLKRGGHIEIQPILQAPQVSALSEQWVRPASSSTIETAMPQLQRRAPRQAACLVRLMELGEAAKKTLVEQGFTYQILKNLHGRGLIEDFDREIVRDPLASIDVPPPERLAPTVDQQRAIDFIRTALDRRTFCPALLQGVTGSGKTLVYIQAVAQTLAQDRSAIILVPEIALAWQMVRRFKAHFGAQVAVLHSQLSEGERHDTWRRLSRGEQRIVIGARSAVLAPVSHPGLIVVDEEHDSSYKQEDLESTQPLFYNARDLALVRGQKQGAVVLLGSATPSLESYWNARNKKYHLLTLPQRIDDRPLPRVEVVDMRREPFQKKQRAIFSRTLRLKIKERLERGEKTVLLQNRRGFAPFIVCTSCGEAVQCESCRVSLTYHRAREPQTRCHYCDFNSSLAAACSFCGSPELRFEGVGTQKVEDALVEQFPGIRVIRMDVDTTGWKGAHDHLIERFRKGEADVLLGTQMVAKGLDFPTVTLVGVISADTGMHQPDFRAAERSFQLLTQVAGRSGRGAVPGEVVIQTLMPESPVLQAAAAQAFEEFVEMELSERQGTEFPPFGRLVVFRWRGRDEAQVEAVARQCTTCLGEITGGEVALLGPAPAPLARLRGYYRWQALMRGSSPGQLHKFTANSLPAMQQIARKSAVVLTVNVDPLTMM